MDGYIIAAMSECVSYNSLNSVFSKYISYEKLLLNIISSFCYINIKILVSILRNIKIFCLILINDKHVKHILNNSTFF